MSRNWRDADDPCLVLQRKQERTCAGCALLTVQACLGARKFVCRRGKQKASTDIQEMRRCKAYAEREAAIKAAE
ncbi:hypothetical protein [Paraburkholderia caballeronis]|uniref:hypothetical protein n=1 Tax=Paraburkholderia caballeronis TaxID=416943 RepID=UPI001066B557|nr:hypothetical protein [Paraburkholderia caballeronis]TDV04672.1 hypothetical protein C7408_13134 [Paraburkholderia caballeronis]TDV07915.1 hypothetical protein C7406_13334 [Paraburkholderia caballeronis]TDV18206.1 hypothetical protein C7404_13134 [Paraburkholderia caballeronis]